MRTAVFSGLACKGTARGPVFSALLFTLCCLLWSNEAAARRPLDRYVRPQPGGTHLRLFGFFGPGLRAILESYIPIEEDMSELRLQAWGDVNYGYTQISGHADFRFFLLGFGGSIGYRDEWRTLQFQPGANGLDHGEDRLNNQLRRDKETDGDSQVTRYPLAEGRVSVFMPLDPLLGLSIFSARWEDRRDNSYDWETATVYNSGMSYRWETLLPFHYRNIGFLGPAFRAMYVNRGQPGGKPAKWEGELHYGFVAGTSPDWVASNDQILVRIYATYGLDNDYFGTHTFHIPMQIIVGYQADIDF